MKVPYSHLLKNLPFKIPDRKDQALTLGKQLLHLPLSILSGAGLTGGLAHLLVFSSDLFSQPSKSRLKKISKYYDIKLPKKKVNKPLLGLVSGIGVMSATPLAYQLASMDMFRFIQENPHVIEDVSLYGLAFSGIYHFSKLMYHALPVAKSVHEFFHYRGRLKKAYAPYFKSADDPSALGKKVQLSYLLHKDQERGFAALLKHRFGGGNFAEGQIPNLPLETILHQHGTNPYSLLLASLIDFELDKDVQHKVYMKAKEKALEEKNYRMLSVLSFFDFVEQGSKKMFRETLPLTFADSSLEEIVIGQGMTTPVTTKSTTGGEDALSLLFATKNSDDYIYFKQRKILTEYLEDLRPGRVSTMLGLDSIDDRHYLHEVRIWGNHYGTILGKQPQKIHLLNDFAHDLSTLLADGNFLFLEKVNFVDKHKNDIFYDANTEKDMNILQELMEMYGIFMPIMDNHPEQSIEYYGPVYSDVSNKGKGNPMYDPATLFGFAFPYMNYEDLQRETKIGLKKFQDKWNMELPDVEESFLRHYDSRRRRFVDVRVKKNDAQLRNDAQQMIMHSGKVFSDFAENSTQKKLARHFVESTNELQRKFNYAS